MNANTEILQIVNLALMVNDLGGAQVVFDGGGASSLFCVFLYPKDSVAPEEYHTVDTGLPEAESKLRLLRQRLEVVLAWEEERQRIGGVAA